MKIIGIMACAQNGVVGQAGAIPWNYPDERKHFRNIIGTSPIIMGRKTFETMPKSILQDRLSIIFSRTPHLPSTTPLPSSSLLPSSRRRPGPSTATIPPKGWHSIKDNPFGGSLVVLGPGLRRDDGSMWCDGMGGENAFMIGGAELANFFLEQKLLSEFNLTKLHRSYPGDAVLNIKAFDNWKTSLISETADYSIYKLWLT
jgi:dihydrofolate reductase